MAVPKFLQSSLASYNLVNLDVKRDKDIIITEVLNKGDEDALAWLTKNYTKKEVKEVVENPVRGMWLKNTLGYWLKIFGINGSDKKFERAVLNLNV